MLPKGFTPSVLSLNSIFLTSLANCFLYFLSMFLHCTKSAGCLSNSSSLLHSSACHRIIWACLLFANKCFKRGTIGKYHTTFAGDLLFLWFTPSDSEHGSSTCLYHDALHTIHASSCAYSLRYSMQSFRHACIFCTSNPNGQITFLA